MKRRATKKISECFQNVEAVDSPFLRPETSHKHIYPVISGIKSFPVIDPELSSCSCPIHSSALVRPVS